MAIKGKNSEDQEWDIIYDGLTEPQSVGTLACLGDEQKGKVCDSFEVGIIGILEYEIYDIIIMIENLP